ncbi:MAG TPA: hypothetical protein VIS51_09975 [Solirubrobacterales bacterium]
MLPAPKGEPGRPQCLVRLRRSLRDVRKRLAAVSILLFAIICAVVLPAFSLAQYLLVLPSRAVIVGGCFLSAAILAIFITLESSTGNVYKPRRRPMMAMAVLFAFTSAAVLASGIINGNVLPQRLTAEAAIPVGKEPFRVAKAPNEALWIGDRGGEIQSVDPSLGQPIGTPINAGQLLHDLEFFRGFVFATVDRGALVRFDPDPTVPRPLISLRYGSSGGEIAAGRGSVLISDPSHARVYRFSPNLKPIEPIQVNANVEAEATAIALGEGDFLWVLDAGLNVLYKVSLETDEVVMSKRIPDGPETLLVAKGVVYIAHPSLGFIEKRDETTGKLLSRSIPIDAGPTQLGLASDLLLVCNAQTNSVASVSLDTGKQVGDAVAVGATPTDVDFGRHGSTKGWVVNRRSANVTPLVVEPPSPQAKDADG